MSGTIPELRNLQRVIPVAQTQAVHGIAITLLSLELYEDAFASQFRFESGIGIYAANPWVTFEVTDNLARTYTPHMLGGSGGGRPGRLDYRLGFSFAPAINSDVTDLRVEVTTTDFTTWDEAQGKLVSSGYVAGPWVFTVSLS